MYPPSGPAKKNNGGRGIRKLYSGGKRKRETKPPRNRIRSNKNKNWVKVDARARVGQKRYAHKNSDMFRWPGRGAFTREGIKGYDDCWLYDFLGIIVCLIYFMTYI